LDDAIRFEGAAIGRWEGLVEFAGDVYADDLLMGRRSVGLTGHWRDELAALRKGLAALQEERRQFKPQTGSSLTVSHAPFRGIVPGSSAIFSAIVTGPDPIKAVTLVVETRMNGPSEIPMRSTNAVLYRA